MKTFTKNLLVAASSVVMLASVAGPAFATEASSRMEVKTTATGKNGTVSASLITSANAKIDARVSALSNLKSRIDAMQKISTEQKTSLNTTINTSISDMSALRAKINADTDAAVFKTDIQSITRAYRIYFLVMPQGRITAAGDRVITITSLMSGLTARLQTKITEAQAAGKDVTAVNATLADYNAKVTEANVQASAAISLVTTLKPDNGDKTAFEANQKALKDARAKIRVAVSDLKAARQDASSIVKALKSWKISTSASVSTTTK